MTVSATFWSFAAMNQYVAAIPYTTNAATTGPFLWANQGAGSTFTRPTNAPGGRVGAVVGQFLMLGDIYQQQNQTLFTGNGSQTTFTGALSIPVTAAGSISDQQGKLAGTFVNGNIVGSGILTGGTVNYATGSITLNFSSGVPNLDNVIAQYIQSAPYRVQWSAIGDPTNWPIPLTDAAIAAQSGYEDLEVDLGQVMFIAGFPLYGLIFQEFGITRASYVGGQVVFSFAPYERKRGCVAHGAAVQVGAYVFFLADDGFYVTDGANVNPIGTAPDNTTGIDTWFWTNVNAAALSAIRAGYDAVKRSVMFAIPTGSNTLPDTLLTYNILASRWTKSTIASETIWTADNGADNAPGTRQTIGLFDQSHRPNNLSGPPLTGYLETCDMYYIDGARRLITGVRPHITSSDLPQIVVGTRNSLQESVNYSAGSFPDTFSRIAPVLQSGMYSRVRSQSTNASAMNAVTLFTETEGTL